MMGSSNGTPTNTVVNPRDMTVREQQVGYRPGGPLSLVPLASENAVDTVAEAPFADGADITLSCEEQCSALYPNGRDAYMAKKECLLCNACGDICETNIPGTCSELAEQSACGANAESCAACITSTCALGQNELGETAGVCGTVGASCAANKECFKLNNCVADCATKSQQSG